MKLVVLDAATLGADICLSQWEKFGSLNIYQTTPKDLIFERLKDCDIAILNKIVIDKALLEKLPKLKLICITATGFDNIDIDACKHTGVTVCNVMGYSTHSVAQVTVTLALSLMTRLSEYTEYVRSGEYTKSGVQNKLEPVYHELYGKTWGIVGLGNIGNQVAAVAKAMGCNVVCHKRTPDAEIPTLPVDELCKISDIISVHLPLTESTKHIIGKNQLTLMKKDAILINVARGAVVDEAAVVEKIEKGDLGGFGTDVYIPEPLSKESPLWRVLDRKNVLATPHMAWGAFESRMRCINEITKNIEAFLEGAPRNKIV